MGHGASIGGPDQSLPGLIPRRLRRNANSGFSGSLAAYTDVVHIADSEAFGLCHLARIDYVAFNIAKIDKISLKHLRS